MKKPGELWELRVESSRSFYLILGWSYIFFYGELRWPTGYKGKLLPMREIVRMSQSLILFFFLGGGGGDHIKFIVTQPKSVSSDPSFRPWHLKHSHPVGKKYHCVGRYNTFTCYLQLSRKPRPCSSQCAKTNWKPQETKQHHSTERDRNGNHLEVLIRGGSPIISKVSVSESPLNSHERQSR